MTLEARHAVLDALLTVLDDDHAQAIIEYRRVTIKKPLTVYGAGRLAKKLAEFGDANQAADIMIDRCWQGFESSWVKTRPAGRAGKRTFTDVAMDRFNGSTGVQGSGSDAGEFPPDERQSRFDGERLRIGGSGPFVAIRH